MPDRLSRVRHRLARLSRWMNFVSGGEPGRILCWQWATDRGVDCAFCVWIGRLLLDPDHCRKEIE